MKKPDVSGIGSLNPGVATSSLTLLLVEDDLLSREMLREKLGGLFRQIVIAVDGSEGFRLFGETSPDIVLTDQIMPGLSGLDLIKNIRAAGVRTPVVLMTSAIDNQTLLEAINIGIERFVPKPFDFDLIVRTLNGIAREIVIERLLDMHRRQEVEQLRYRDAYHSMQQEAARRKERHVVRHDLRNRTLMGNNGVRWGINISHSPRDIMCGDGYSVRKLCDGRQLIFVVDAMGSGLSASLTAMLTTSFINYQVEYWHHRETFTLQTLVARFQDYLAGMLLDEEVLSCGFLLVNLVKEEIETAIFALPPLLLRGVDGSVRKIRGGNPPLGIYRSEVNIGSFSLSGVADLLIMTDGVTDAELMQGGSYREILVSDFRSSPTLAALRRRFQSSVDQASLDDLTLLHLRRLDFASGWRWSREPEVTLSGLSSTITAFLDELAAEIYLDGVERDGLEVTLTEALTNALEHGCLGIDRNDKSRMLLSGEYDLGKMVIRQEARITLSANLWRGADTPLLLMEICDNGCGMPDDILSTAADDLSVNGRGLQMISRLNDSLFIGMPSGCLIILKTFDGGNTDAD